MPVRLSFQELYVLTWFTFCIGNCPCLVAVISPAALLDVKPISLDSPPCETRPDGVVRGFRLNLRSTRAVRGSHKLLSEWSSEDGNKSGHGLVDNGLVGGIAITRRRSIVGLHREKPCWGSSRRSFLGILMEASNETFLFSIMRQTVAAIGIDENVVLVDFRGGKLPQDANIWVGILH